MEYGTVFSVLPAGYGFVKTIGDELVYVNRRLLSGLSEKDAVRLETEKGTIGRRAISLKKIDIKK